MKNPLKILVLGVLIVTIGAFLKVVRFEYSDIVLSIGLIIEIFVGITYFINRKKKSK